MGPIETEEYERRKSLKATLWGLPGGEEPKRPEPPRYYTHQTCSPTSSWACAMRRDKKEAAIDDIIKAVCLHFQVTRRDLLSQRRHRAIVRPRQIGMYLARHLTKRSLPEVGRWFGDRDHTTVLHAIGKVEQLIADDPQIRRSVSLLREGLE